MGSFQAHLSYNIKPKMWFVIDATYYAGGKSSVNDVYKDDRQDNSRIGTTFGFPVLKRNSIKLAFSTGAIVRGGADFNTFSIGWPSSWIEKRKHTK
mgnify:CR=1 FL=1